MNDSEILDGVVRILETGFWTDCKRNRQELVYSIKRQREGEELTQKIEKEVARQLKALRKTKNQERCNVRSIVKEIETEVGSAHIDEILKRAAKLGFKKDQVEAEIARLVQEAAIFEPVRYSQNYRTSQAY